MEKSKKRFCKFTLPRGEVRTAYRKAIIKSPESKTILNITPKQVISGIQTN